MKNLSAAARRVWAHIRRVPRTAAAAAGTPAGIPEALAAEAAGRPSWDEPPGFYLILRSGPGARLERVDLPAQAWEAGTPQDVLQALAAELREGPAPPERPLLHGVALMCERRVHGGGRARSIWAADRAGVVYGVLARRHHPAPAVVAFQVREQGAVRGPVPLLLLEIAALACGTAPRFTAV